MLFIMNAQGTITASLPSPLHQGSSLANTIELVAPFPASSVVELTFTLPNGVTVGANYSNPFRMTVTELNNITDGNGKGYNAWRFVVPYALTKLAGELLVQFSIFGGGETLTSGSTVLPITQGTEHLDVPYTESDYDIVRQYVAAAERAAEEAAEAAANAPAGFGFYYTPETLRTSSAIATLGFVQTGGRDLHTGDYLFTSDSLLFRVGVVSEETCAIEYMFSFRGEEGTPGQPGPQGDAATVSVANTVTLPAGQSARVENIGTEQAARLQFSIPRGQQGADGSSMLFANTSTTSATTTIPLSAIEGHTASAGDIILTASYDVFLVNGLGGANAHVRYLYNIEGKAAATITVGSTTTAAAGESASVENVGTENAAVLNFSIPRGAVGPQGAAGTIIVGNVESGPTAAVTNTGTPQNAILNFTLPRGERGAAGENAGIKNAANLPCNTNTGAPGSAASASVTISGSNTEKEFAFDFTIPAGYNGAAIYASSFAATSATTEIPVADILNAGNIAANDLVVANGLLFSVAWTSSTAVGVTYLDTLKGAPGAAGGGSNPNILVNADFLNPINQRGLTTYSVPAGMTITYTVDSWELWGAPTTTVAEVTQYGMRVYAAANFVLFSHYLENLSAFAGKTLTLSIESAAVSDPTVAQIASGTFTVPATISGIIDLLQIRIPYSSSSFVNVYKSTNGIPYLRTAVTAEDSAAFYIRRIKLELGATSTLANDPPADPEITLLQCERYVYALGEKQAGKALLPLGIVESDTRIRFPVKAKMRAVPSFDTTQVKVMRDGAEIPVTSWTVEQDANTTNLIANGTGFVRPTSAFYTKTYTESLGGTFQQSVSIGWAGNGSATLSPTPIKAGSVRVEDTNGDILQDDGNGHLIEPNGGAAEGTINYTTGALTITNTSLASGTATVEFVGDSVQNNDVCALAGYPVLRYSVVLTLNGTTTAVDNGNGAIESNGTTVARIDYESGVITITNVSGTATASVTYKSTTPFSEYGTAEMVAKTTGQGNIVLSAEI